MGQGRRGRPKLILVVMASWARGQRGKGVLGTWRTIERIQNYQFARIQVVGDIQW